jgi:putative copper export protein
MLAFWPGGIVAVVYGVLVNRRLAAGDVAGATRASHLAKRWCWISVVIGAVLAVLLLTGAVRNPYASH